MPEKADISRTLLLPFMSIILLVAVYMTANVLLPLKASGKGSKESEDVQERQHLSDDAGDGEVVEMNINFSEKCIVIDSGHGGADPGKVGVAGTNEKEINLAIAKKLQERLDKTIISGGKYELRNYPTTIIAAVSIAVFSAQTVSEENSPAPESTLRPPACNGTHDVAGVQIDAARTQAETDAGCRTGRS